MTIKNALLGATCVTAFAALAARMPLDVFVMAAPTVADLEARVVELNAESEDFRARIAAGEELSDDEPRRSRPMRPSWRSSTSASRR
jgi:hypothetical protein